MITSEQFEIISDLVKQVAVKNECYVSMDFGLNYEGYNPKTKVRQTYELYVSQSIKLDGQSKNYKFKSPEHAIMFMEEMLNED